MASTVQSRSLLSLLYLALLTFVGSAVLLAEMHQHSLLSYNSHTFLAVLMISSCIWMLWFGWHSAGNKRLKMHQDHQAGANWLKGKDVCLSVALNPVRRRTQSGLQYCNKRTNKAPEF